jgi:hypothetical protein
VLIARTNELGSENQKISVGKYSIEESFFRPLLTGVGGHIDRCVIDEPELSGV